MVFYFIIIAGFAVLGIFLYKISKKFDSKKEPDQNFLLLNQRLDTLASSTNQALRETLQLVTGHLKENRESTERSVTAVNQQVQNFTQGITSLSENLKQVHTSVKDVVSFQNIFKSPKLRGIWGESSLEASLGQYFSKDIYELQHYFKSGEAVDAVLHLPNSLILPIDSKFNWENFEKMINAENDINREVARKAFYSDVKKRIDEIASKYILPSEGTTNLALMYVPAETVYYEIINNIKDVDIPSYARSKRVFMVSPNTFALSVSAIQHWFRDVQITKQTQEILKKLGRVTIDGHKLGEDFRRLGKHLSDAQGSYTDSEKRLDLMLDRVENLVEVEDSGKTEKVLVE